MTEYNIFCYSKKYHNEDSFQQKCYRAFNKDVGVDRFTEIVAEVKKIIPNKEKLTLNDFWKSITNEQWKRLLAIPEAKDFKKGFEYISGRKITLNEDCNDKEVEIDGKRYKLKLIK